jgi:hypothetical protein
MKLEQIKELKINLKLNREDLQTLSNRNKGLVIEAFDSNTSWGRTGKLKKAIAKNNLEIDKLNYKIREAEIKLGKL